MKYDNYALNKLEHMARNMSKYPVYGLRILRNFIWMLNHFGGKDLK